MKKIKYNGTDEFANKMKRYSSILDKEPVICVFGHYEVIKDILQSVVRTGVHIGYHIALEDCATNKYDKEFVLYIDENGVSVEKAWHEKNRYHDAMYFDSECDIAFIHDDCNSRILKHIRADLMIEFTVDEDVENGCYFEDFAHPINEINTEEGHKFVIKFNLDADDALETIRDMENRMDDICNKINSINNIQRLLGLYR